MVSKMDWPKQVPLALFAMRLSPCRSTGLSPFEYVYGRQAGHSPLDLLYESWVCSDLRPLNVSAWTEELDDRLAILRDKAFLCQPKTRNKRKDTIDKTARERSFEPGSRVLVRIPGLLGKLEES